MRINQQNHVDTAETRIGKSKSSSSISGGQQTETGRQTSGASDGFQISSLASNLLGLATMGSPQHAQKLEQLSMDVQSGRYQVDAMVVSRAMISAAFQPAI